jgi:hypothetical protein
MKENTRPRGKPIYVWVTPEERGEIETRATATNLSLSAYLRVLGLGHKPRSSYDAEAVLSLAKVNADQGRLGGLLKLWLTTKKDEGASTAEVKKLLREIENLQKQLAEIVGLVRPS